MKLAIATAIVALVAAPAFAADYPDSNPSASVAPQSDPNVDSQTAAADAARENLYRDKLEAAKAQSQVDSAKADRDAAQDRAAQDRADRDAAQQ